MTIAGTGLLIFAIVLTAACMVYFAWMHRAPLSGGGADALVVLGYACRGDTIHPYLEERLKTALALWENHEYRMIILSGGPVGGSCSEARLMKEFLVRRGIPPGQILLESESRNTVENMMFTRKLMETFDLPDVLWVSNSFHIRRMTIIAGRLGLPVRCWAARDKMTLLRQVWATFRELKAFYITLRLLKKQKERKADALREIQVD